MRGEEGGKMDDKTKTIIKMLINTIEGAPYPLEINSELYNIWYEHSKIAANDALMYMSDKIPEEELKNVDDAFVD